jgi:hypothetical protein
MKLNKTNKKNVLLLVIYLVSLYFFKGYLDFYPSIPIYPNNEVDLKIMKKYMKKRTQQDVEFFYKTNDTVSWAFYPYVDETIQELDEIAESHNHIIYFFKYLINRRRPYQIDRNIKPLSTKTSNTPAFPAGHAYQALLVAKSLSKKYPHKKKLFDKIALRCDDCRIKAGIHYKSDGEFSKSLFNVFN